MPGAVPVQIERISMETWDNLDNPEPIFGTDGTIYHHLDGVEVVVQDFESAGWGFDSLRVRKQITQEKPIQTRMGAFFLHLLIPIDLVMRIYEYH